MLLAAEFGILLRIHLKEGDPMMDMGNLHYYHASWIQKSEERLSSDVCIYGGTAAGVVAAAKAARLGLKVVLLQPGQHLGGMTTGGLGWTDHGRKHVIGGMSRQFYRDLGAHYGRDEEWHFEPHVAEALIERLAGESGIVVRRAAFLDQVEKAGDRIAAVTLLGGARVTAKVFIDATYEGDLMAKAGVAYTVGREGNALYGEQLNGIQVRDKHQFSHVVDPYVVLRDPSSGLLPWIVADDLSKRQGEGDRRVQAYNFRMCMTDDPALRIDWVRPPAFDASQYVLAVRWFSGPKDGYNDQLKVREGMSDPVLSKFDILSARTAGGYRKTDTNNHGPVSSDLIGANYDWPEGSYELREAIFQRHVAYQMGFYWYMANAPEIPERYRAAYRQWGLASDEFKDTDHWPHQLYVREARRMVSSYVITEHDCRGEVRTEDPVGMASYTMDSHNCARFVKEEGGVARVMNEGDVQVVPTDPYPISYRAVVPRRGDCANLLVPVCLSASHIAYGSARMEPVFMVLGESVALAAALAIRHDCAVQDVPYPELREQLIAAGQVLALPAKE